jgi:hypothetical protein
MKLRSLIALLEVNDEFLYPLLRQICLRAVLGTCHDVVCRLKHNRRLCLVDFKLDHVMQQDWSYCSLEIRN